MRQGRQPSATAAGRRRDRDVRQTGARTAGFLRSVVVDERTAVRRGYPFDLPVVQGLLRAGQLPLDPGVTFLVGENGTGKSTLVEAIAVAAGFNAEGGSRSFSFATRSTESSLGEHLRLVRSARRERSSFFLRAESFYNVATEIEHLEQVDPGLLPAYGGRSPHQRSHGESFLDLLRHRFVPGGLYLMDEPEAALSPQGVLAALTRIHDLAADGSQFIIATHSPILLAVPGATIMQVEADGSIDRVGYDEAEVVEFTRRFLEAPERTLRHLFGSAHPSS